MDRRYQYLVGHGQHCRFTASLNGVPFFRTEATKVPNNRSGAANHLLRPGKNTFELDLQSAGTSAMVVFQLRAEDDPDRPIYSAIWPIVAKDLPPEQRRLPYRCSATFEADGLTQAPSYLDAPRIDFDEKETEAVREAVKRFYTALETRDVEGVIREGRLKIDEYRRFYPEATHFSEAGTRASFSGFFGSNPYVPPYDAETMRVQSCAGGRAAYVTGTGGEPAIVAEGEGNTFMKRDLWLTRREGRWQLFR